MRLSSAGRLKRPFVRVVKSRDAVGVWLPGSVRGSAGSRSYLVYVPADAGRRSRMPLVVLLHGGGQTAAGFAATTGFSELADRHGFIVVCPQQSLWNQQRRTWRWFDPAHQQRGAGEPAIIAEITAAVLAEQTRWQIDPTRVYVAGLSAGGGMALILAATYPDVYAAVGVHSAPAYRSAASSAGAPAAMAGRATAPPPRLHADGGQGMAPAIVFQGTDDTTVRLKNGLGIAEQWLAHRRAYAARANGDAKAADRITHTTSKIGQSPGGRAYAVTRWYTARGRKMLEYWQVDGLEHAWSGGAAGASFSDPAGPSASEAMWSFFSSR